MNYTQKERKKERKKEEEEEEELKKQFTPATIHFPQLCPLLKPAPSVFPQP